MRRREDHPLQKHTFNLYAGTYQKLQVLYPKIGAAKAARDILYAHVRKVEESAAQRMPLVGDLDIEMETYPNE